MWEQFFTSFIINGFPPPAVHYFSNGITLDGSSCVRHQVASSKLPYRKTDIIPIRVCLSACFLEESTDLSFLQSAVFHEVLKHMEMTTRGQ